MDNKIYEDILKDYLEEAKRLLPFIEDVRYAEPPAEQRDFINVHLFTPSELKDYLIRAYQDDKLRKQAIFIWGGFGIGKSMLIKDTARELARLEAVKECSKEKDKEYCEVKTVCVVPDHVERVKEEDKYTSSMKTRGVSFCGPYDAESKEMDKVYTYYIEWNEVPDEIKFQLYEDSELRKKSFILADFRLSLIGDPAQFTGPIVPELDKGLSRWFPPLLFRTLSKPETKGILFFDEFNQAIRQIMLSAYQIILDRQIGDLALSDKVMVIAAGNPPFEVPSTPLPYPPEPLRDRFEEVYMVGKVGDWFKWAFEHNIHPIILVYIANKVNITQTGDVLYDPNNKSKLKPTTPRAWERASNILWAYNDTLEHYITEVYSQLEKALREPKYFENLYEIYKKHKQKLEELRDKLSMAVGINYAQELLEYIDPLGDLIQKLAKEVPKEPQQVINVLADYIHEWLSKGKLPLAYMTAVTMAKIFPPDTVSEILYIELPKVYFEKYPTEKEEFMRVLDYVTRTIVLTRPKILSTLITKYEELPKELKEIIGKVPKEELFYQLF